MIVFPNFSQVFFFCSIFREVEKIAFAKFEKKEATVGSSNSSPLARLCLAAALGVLNLASVSVRYYQC